MAYEIAGKSTSRWRLGRGYRRHKVNGMAGVMNTYTARNKPIEVGLCYNSFAGWRARARGGASLPQTFKLCQYCCIGQGSPVLVIVLTLIFFALYY